MNKEIIEVIESKEFKLVKEIRGINIYEKEIKLVGGGMKLVNDRIEVATNSKIIKYKRKKVIQETIVYVTIFKGKIFTNSEMKVILNIMER